MSLQVRGLLLRRPLDHKAGIMNTAESQSNLALPLPLVLLLLPLLLLLLFLLLLLALLPLLLLAMQACGRPCYTCCQGRFLPYLLRK